MLNASNITAGTGSNNIGGVVLNASNITAGTGSNNVGGVTLSNTRILAAAGTAAAPSYSFSDDLGVGMFDAGTNALGLATSGLERMRIDTSGNVGIGTATPFCRVQVVTPGSVVNEITSSLAESAADPDFKLVATKGNLGGGFGGISTKFGLVYRTGGVNTSNGFINFHRGIGPSDGFLSFSTSNIERMRIDPAGAMTVNGSELIYGNVGIGVTDPIVALDVSGMIRVRGTSNVSSPNRGFLALEPYSFGTTPIAGDTTVAQLVFSNDSGGGPWYATMGAVISNGGFADGMDLRFTTNRSSGDRTQVPRMTIRSFTGHVGIGTTNPAYALDVCSSAGVASVNMRTWPRFPVTNVLMAIAQLTQLGGLNGGAYNFSNPIQTMDTNLITFTASNASVGASFIIRRSGLWNINFLFHTGNAQYVFIDVSTGNVASNSYGSNGTRPIAFGGQGGGGVNMVTYTGYLPSNASYLYKFRGGSNLATVGLGTNTLQITFLGETPDSAAAFPF